MPPDTHARSQSSVPLLQYAAMSPPMTPLSSTFRKPRFPLALAHRRRTLVFVVACLSVVSLGLLASLSLRSTSAPPSVVQEQDATLAPGAEDLPLSPMTEVAEDEDVPTPEPELEPIPQYSPFLRGPPTQSFRANLRDDTLYITSWISAGWTNDVMTYINLIYMGIVTDRVPVVAMFTPSHIAPARAISFGSVFDVKRFTQESGVPLLEWFEVKDPNSQVVDAVGCWNVWESVQYYEHYPRGSSVPDMLNLDISYTRAPEWIKMIPNYEHDKCSTYWQLARLAYPEDRDKNLGHTLPSPRLNATLEPDEHMLCYDYLYYACAALGSEWDYEFAPAWRFVGQYLHWTPYIENLTAQYVNRVLGLPENGPMPLYISIHVRHGDFGNWCWEAEEPEDCFAPLSVIARRVREVQDELSERKGVEVPMSRVIMTSDETDPEWWDEVASYGWVKMDHDEMKTVENHGKWYPVLLDAAIQSLGVGFVGTDRSTFSIVARRRVLDWQDGAARMVLWGKKGADDH